MPAPPFNGSFAHNWTAEILPQRPLILPSRHFVYPNAAEEVEKGALEVLVRPGGAVPQPFLATCALGFRDPMAPTGIWPAPHPDWMCAVSGGYAYLVNTAEPEQFHMIRYRPVLEIYCCLEELLLLFVGHHAILAWGKDGEAWESDRLSWEGITVTAVEGAALAGHGWDWRTDQELPFTLDLRTGRRT